MMCEKAAGESVGTSGCQHTPYLLVTFE